MHLELLVFFDVVTTHNTNSDSYGATSFMVPNDPVAPAALGPAEQVLGPMEVNQKCGTPRHGDVDNRAEEEQHDELEQATPHTVILGLAGWRTGQDR